AEAGDADLVGALRAQLRDDVADVPQRVLELQDRVLLHRPFLVRAAEMVEQVRRGDEIALGGQPLAHAQELLADAAALLADDDSRPRWTAAGTGEEVGNRHVGHGLKLGQMPRWVRAHEPALAGWWRDRRGRRPRRRPRSAPGPAPGAAPGAPDALLP